MPKRRSAVEQRKEQITAQIQHLHTQFSAKTRQDYTTEFRYEMWLKQSNNLIDELLDEITALNEPGEYNELPMAIVADELGLSLHQVKNLIKIGEIEVTGRRAHERVSRKELERLAKLGTDEILKRSRQNVDEVFIQAVASLRNGDLDMAEESYRRLKARQSIIGNQALATEIAIHLVKGMYEKVGQVVRFIHKEKFYDRLTIGTYLAEFLRDVHFKDRNARTDMLHLIKPLINSEVKESIRTSKAPDDLQFAAMYISEVVIEGLEEFFMRSSLSTSQRAEFYQLMRDRIFSALYAEAHSFASFKSKAFIITTKQRVPYYWEPARLIEILHED
jgi:hypothetical protein